MDSEKSSFNVETPLGNLQVFVRLNGTIIEEPDSDLASCYLIPIEYSFTMEYDSVSETEHEKKRSIVLHCSTRKEIRQLTFECRWEESTNIGRGRPECDHAINATRWTKNGNTVLVGTENADGLWDRVVRGKNITPGLKKCLSEITPELDHLIFSFKDDGFIIRLTEIPANEKFQLFYMVSWGDYPEPEPEATWLALNSLPESIQTSIDIHYP